MCVRTKTLTRNRYGMFSTFNQKHTFRIIYWKAANDTIKPNEHNFRSLAFFSMCHHNGRNVRPTKPIYSSHEIRSKKRRSDAVSKSLTAKSDFKRILKLRNCHLFARCFACLAVAFLTSGEHFYEQFFPLWPFAGAFNLVITMAKMISFSIPIASLAQASKPRFARVTWFDCGY